jgi:hypothetical protein
LGNELHGPRPFTDWQFRTFQVGDALLDRCCPILGLGDPMFD